MARLLDRRSVLELGAAALAWGPLPALAQAGASRKRLVVRYRTSGERVARVVPPPLVPSGAAVVEVEIDWVEPARADLLALEPFGVARVSVAVEHERTRGRLPLGVYAGNDRARLVAREGRGLPAKDAEIELETDGAALLAKVVRRGRTLLSATATVTEESDAAELAPLLTPVFSVAPDWRKDVIKRGSAELWQIETTGGPSRVVADVALDLPFASPGDPLAELPVEEILGAWLVEDPRDSEPAKLAELDAQALEAWAPLRIDRPVERERFWMPAGWREQASAYRLNGGELERYRARREIVLGPIEVVEIDAMIAREAHEALLPPVCRSAGRPMIKLLGLRVGESALSPVPFSELWLFAFSITANRAAWYAVSHIVGPGGDLTFGRDVYGYPSKAGVPEVLVTPINFSLGAKRLGRELVYADGGFHGFSTGTSLAQLPMASLRAKPGGSGADLVFQMWTFQGRRNRIDPKSFQMGLPDGEAPGLDLRPDPWYELGETRPAMLSVMENGVMQRTPGEVVAELPDFEPFYRERCDGVLPWEPRPAELGQPTLLAKRPTGTSS